MSAKLYEDNSIVLPLTLTRNKVDSLFHIVCYNIVNNPKMSPKSYENLLPNPIKRIIKPIHEKNIHYRGIIKSRIEKIEKKHKWQLEDIINNESDSDDGEYENSSINNISKVLTNKWVFLPVSNVFRRRCKIVTLERFHKLNIDKIYQFWRKQNCDCIYPFYEPCQLYGCGHVFCYGCIKTVYYMGERVCPLCRQPFVKNDIRYNHGNVKKLSTISFDIVEEALETRVRNTCDNYDDHSKYDKYCYLVKNLPIIPIDLKNQWFFSSLSNFDMQRMQKLRQWYSENLKIMGKPMRRRILSE